jgi:hypothetical protein
METHRYPLWRIYCSLKMLYVFGYSKGLHVTRMILFLSSTKQSSQPHAPRNTCHHLAYVLLSRTVLILDADQLHINSTLA